MNTINKLFVYGTLGPGRPNEHVMTNIGGEWQDARLKGKLIEAGWGAVMGFPGIQLDDNADDVKGFIFTSDNLINHWHELDEFEGSAYQRVIANVSLSSGDTVQAYVYTIRT